MVRNNRGQVRNVRGQTRNVRARPRCCGPRPRTGQVALAASATWPLSRPSRPSSIGILRPSRRRSAPAWIDEEQAALKIAVCVKEVPDATAPKRVDAGTKRLDRSGEKTMNPYDAHALEDLFDVFFFVGLIGRTVMMPGHGYHR